MPETVQSVVVQLKHLLTHPADLPSGVPDLQKRIWSVESRPHDDARWEVLRDLAYDLEYYQPDSKVRSEDNSYYGDERAIEEIKGALEHLCLE